MTMFAKKDIEEAVYTRLVDLKKVDVETQAKQIATYIEDLFMLTEVLNGTYRLGRCPNCSKEEPDGQ